MTEKGLQKIDRINIVVAMTATVGSLFFFPTSVSVGVAAGVILMTLNFYVLRKLTIRLFSGARKTVLVSAVLLGLKLMAFLGVAALCVHYLPMNIIAFGIGAVVIVFAAVISTLSLQSSSASG